MENITPFTTRSDASLDCSSPAPQMDTRYEYATSLPKSGGSRAIPEGDVELVYKAANLLGTSWAGRGWQEALSFSTQAQWQNEGHRQQTHPLLLVPVHLQRRPAVPPRPPGHEGVLVVPKHHLLLLTRRGGGLGGNVVGSCRVQPVDGVGQQLAVAHGDQLPGLQYAQTKAAEPPGEGLQGRSSLRAQELS